MFKNLTKLFGIACVVVPSSAVASRPNGQSTEPRPNILFILSDDHTSQSWGIYGGILAPYVRNENIRRLASEGCVLDNAFCTNSISVPSRATIMTGQYSHRNGVYTLADALEPEHDNIAKQLQASGYQTALIGKWHLEKQPSGFDYFSVFHDQGEYINPRFNTAESWGKGTNGKSGVECKGFSTDIVTDKTIEWINNRDKERPFMMFCHFKATHEPFDFPERLTHIYDGVVFPEPENLMEFGSQQSGRTFSGQTLEELSRRWSAASAAPDKWWCRYPELPFSVEGLDSVAARRKSYQKFMRDYLRCGAAVDDNIGRLLTMLDKQELSDNTIVIYVADQGYFLGEHGFFDKRLFYEESLRMPFVIRYPKEIQGGTRNKDIIMNIDFAPLLADYAQAKPPVGAQGVSFRDNLRGETPNKWRKSMYYRYWTQHRERPAHMGVRTDRYKLMFIYGDKLHTKGSSDDVSEPSWEFYDLHTDPNENQNRYNDEKYAKIIAEMKKELLRLRSEYGDTDHGSRRMTEIIRNLF